MIRSNLLRHNSIEDTVNSHLSFAKYSHLTDVILKRHARVSVESTVMSLFTIGNNVTRAALTITLIALKRVMIYHQCFHNKEIFYLFSS